MKKLRIKAGKMQSDIWEVTADLAGKSFNDWAVEALERQCIKDLRALGMPVNKDDESIVSKRDISDLRNIT